MRSRVFSFLAALLFLFTSVGVSAAVIWQIKEDNKKDTESAEEARRDQQQQAANVKPKFELPEVYKTEDKVADLQITDLQVGDGEEVKEGDTVTVFYHGTRAKDGSVFDSSYQRGEAIDISLNQVIEGWRKGIPGMKVGGQRRLVIPSAMAYGEQGSGDIGANEDLVFVVEVTKTQHQ